MKSYILFILSRAGSGLMNGAFYGRLRHVPYIGALFTLIATVLSLRAAWRQHKPKKQWRAALFVLLAMGCIAALGLTVLSFTNPTFALADVHLWTLLTQTFQAGALWLAGDSPLKLLLAVAPAVFLQKLLVNAGGGEKLFYAGTEVAHGKWYGFKLLGWKIPRLGDMRLRLLLAVLSIALAIFLHQRQKKALLLEEQNRLENLIYVNARSPGSDVQDLFQIKQRLLLPKVSRPHPV